jgi:ascorbate-specific PTS system EIIC-type component UlaA
MSEEKLLKIYEQNYEHIRHMETHRIVSLNIYVAVTTGVLYVVSRQSNLIIIIISLFVLLFLSLFSYASSRKTTQITQDYKKSIEDIIEVLEIDKKFVGYLRPKKKRRESVLKNKLLSISLWFERFYIVMTITIMILIVYYIKYYANLQQYSDISQYTDNIRVIASRIFHIFVEELLNSL